MPIRCLSLALAAFLILAAAATAQDRAATQTTVQITHGNGESSAPAISGDERFDRVLAFQSDASDLVSGDTNGATDIFIARNANPDVNASQPWTPTGLELVSKGLGGQPANGRSYGPAIDGKAGEPPTPPKCVAFVSDASNLVRGDTNGQPDVFVAKLGGAITRVSVSSSGGQANGPSFDVSVDGTCERVAFSARASSLGGGGGRQVYVHYLTGPNKHQTVVASATGKKGKPMSGEASHPSYMARTNGAQDKVAFQDGDSVFTRDLRRSKTTKIAGGGASEPVLSDQGFVVAFVRGGALFTDNRGHTEQISDPNAGSASDPTIGAGGAYVAYAASGGSVVLYTAVRQLSLTESVSADHQPLTPATDPAVSSRGNEVFFVHQGQIYSRYLGGK